MNRSSSLLIHVVFLGLIGCHAPLPVPHSPEPSSIEVRVESSSGAEIEMVDPQGNVIEQPFRLTDARVFYDDGNASISAGNMIDRMDAVIVDGKFCLLSTMKNLPFKHERLHCRLVWGTRFLRFQNTLPSSFTSLDWSNAKVCGNG